jgi:nucleoid-associated protein YgaU
MGLFDFFQKGEKTPAQPAARPTQPGGNTPDFLKTGTAAGQPTPPAPAAATGAKYTVKSGDSLSKIAKAHYGDAQKWHQIYDANKALIGNDPDMIQPGQELTLPKA